MACFLAGMCGGDQLKLAAGTVLMWESWLRHEVPPNAAKN